MQRPCLLEKHKIKIKKGNKHIITRNNQLQIIHLPPNRKEPEFARRQSKRPFFDIRRQKKKKKKQKGEYCEEGSDR